MRPTVIPVGADLCVRPFCGYQVEVGYVPENGRTHRSAPTGMTVYLNIEK